VSGNIKHVKDLVVPILKPHLEKNVTILNEIFDYISSVAFLNLLLNAPEYSEERKALFRDVATLISPILDQRSFEKTRCKFGACWRACVPAHSNENFPASPWCAKHHFVNFESVSKNPTATYFLLGEGASYQPFITFMEKKLPPYNLDFFKATHNYSCAKASIKKVFAQAVNEKFLAAGSKAKVGDFDEKLAQQIGEKIAKASEGGDDIDPMLYDAANKFLLERIDKVFKAEFAGSNEFKNYLKSITLPKYLLDDLEYRQKNKDEVKRLELAEKTKVLAQLAEDKKRREGDSKDEKSPQTSLLSGNVSAAAHAFVHVSHHRHTSDEKGVYGSP